MPLPRPSLPLLLGLPLVLLLGAPASGQRGAVPGLDVQLLRLKDMQTFGRTSSYPSGRTGAAFLTTVCNVGQVEVPWHKPMNVSFDDEARAAAGSKLARLLLSDGLRVRIGDAASSGPP